ncbi:hypothetical protein IJI69_00350 [Candidatus Saccharibacteria bacterium]|nr:hypothetical protein [Candidatus Saccharibacteria bacterium]MBQ6127139.1 hypothetical protein [Candidatus Saccharibacteria bacterium]
MAITTYPLNNIDYNAEQAMLANLPITSGIYPYGTNFPLTTSSGLTAEIGTGLAYMHYDTAAGFTVYMDSPQSISFDGADTVLDRIDRVVLRWQFTTNDVQLLVLKGTPSSSPTAVARQTSSTAYDLVLYDVRINHGQTSLPSSVITDRRSNSQYCGYMSNRITQIDTSAISSQIDGLVAQQADTIQTAVETALDTAKDSGDFSPVKGVDYWTATDQNEIVDEVLAAFTDVSVHGWSE